MSKNSRYIRQISLPEIGEAGQQKLKDASVLVVGAGGLGCPALMGLTAAGTGTIGIVDGDRVEQSNLHRQVLYTEKDVSKLKAETAAERLRAMNSDVKIQAYPVWLSRENAMEIIGKFDIVIDGTDNFPARYLINDACVFTGKPFVYGSIYRFEGQVSLFNHLNDDGSNGPNYRDLFPEPPPAELVPDCSEAGVLGVLPGLIGNLQAAEVIKWITITGDLLNGKLLIGDLKSHEYQAITVPKRDDNPLTGKNPSITELIDYERFCNPQSSDSVPEISPDELAELLERGEKVRLIDVRTPEEHQHFNIGGELMPLEEFDERSFISDTGNKTIFYCRTGRRSGEAVKKVMGMENVFNLRGGIEAWKRKILS
jgi:sulfur-carrier protein adenylyltransferase/sulfurtransferase